MGINIGGALAAINPMAAIGTAMVGDVASTAYQNRMEDRRMHEKMNYEQQMNATRYQTQVKDLMAAGLNPMLAYGQGPGQAVSAPNTPPIQRPEMIKDIARNVNETRIASAQEQNIKADTRNKELQSELIEAQTGDTATSADLKRQQIDQIGYDIDKTVQQIKTLRSEVVRNNNDAFLKSELATTEQRYQILLRKQSSLLGLEYDILDPKARAAKTTGAFGAHGENISKGIRPITDLLPFGHKNYGTGKTYPRRVGDE